MQELQATSHKLPLIILDTMLPRQVLQIQIQHPTLKSLIKHRAITMETPTLGMLGMAKISNTPGAQAVVPLKTGVEVEIIEMDKQPQHSRVVLLMNCHGRSHSVPQNDDLLVLGM